MRVMMMNVKSAFPVLPTVKIMTKLISFFFIGIMCFSCFSVLCVSFTMAAGTGLGLGATPDSTPPSDPTDNSIIPPDTNEKVGDDPSYRPPAGDNNPDLNDPPVIPPIVPPPVNPPGSPSTPQYGGGLAHVEQGQSGSFITQGVPATPGIPVLCCDFYGNSVGSEIITVDEDNKPASSANSFALSPVFGNEVGVPYVEIYTNSPFTSMMGIAITNSDKTNILDKGLGEGYTSINTVEILLLSNKGFLTENDINRMALDIKIPKSKNIDPATIRISSYQQEISPKFISEDDTYYYFQIESTGYLATFTIVGKEIIQVQPYETTGPNVPWTFIIAMTIAASLILVVVLFKAGYIYQEDDLTKKERKIIVPHLTYVSEKNSISTPLQIYDLSWDTTPLPVAQFDTAPSQLLQAAQCEISWHADNKEPLLHMSTITLITD